MGPCEWCGDSHPVTALCVKRPRWSRRGFLTLFGAGVAGLLVAPVAAAEPEWMAFRMSVTSTLTWQETTTLFLAGLEPAVGKIEQWVDAQKRAADVLAKFEIAEISDIVGLGSAALKNGLDDVR